MPKSAASSAQKAGVDQPVKGLLHRSVAALPQTHRNGRLLWHIACCKVRSYIRLTQKEQDEIQQQEQELKQQKSGAGRANPKARFGSLLSSAAAFKNAVDGTTNRGFLYLSPQANSSKAQEAVRQLLAKHRIAIVGEGKIPTKVIDQEMLVDQQHYRIASVATLLKPSQALINAQLFERLTGVGWRTVLDNRCVFNALDALDYLGVSPDELSQRWKRAEAAGRVYRVGEHQYVGLVGGDDNEAGRGVGLGGVGLGGTASTSTASTTSTTSTRSKPAVFVLNGFFPALRQRFTNPGLTVHYFSVRWTATQLSYAAFLNDVVGEPLPRVAAAGSVRTILSKRWKALGLKSKPTSANIGLHVSGSPLQALMEQIVWMYECMHAFSCWLRTLLGV